MYLKMSYLSIFLTFLVALCAFITNAQSYPEHKTLESISFENLDAKVDEAQISYINDPSHTLQLCRLILDFAVKQNDVKLFLKVNGIAGNTYYHHGYYSLWVDHCEKSLSEPFVTEHQELEARVYQHLGIALEMQGKFAASLEAYLKSRELVRQMDDLHEYHTSSLNLAMLYEKIQQIDKSIELLFSAKDYFKEINDSSFLALTYQNLGMLYDRLSDHDNMEYYTRKSMNLYSNLGDSVKLLDLHLNMVVVYLKRKEINPLRYHFTAAKHLLLPTSPKVHLFNFLAANKAYFLENYIEADSLYALALNGFKAHNRTTQVVESYRGRILVSHALRQTDSLEVLLEDLIDFQNQQFNQSMLDRFAEYELKYETRRLEDEMKTMALENSNQMIRMQWLFIFLGFVTLATALITILYIRLNNAYKKLYTFNRAFTYETRFLPVVKHTEVQVEEEIGDSQHRLALYNQAVKIMSEQAMYRDPKLSVQDLATALNSNTKYLSQAINNCSDMNFNAFVNEFRVTEAKKILSLADNNALSMETIAAMAGFSQRSQLYRVFTASTGLTPGQFKKLNNEG